MAGSTLSLLSRPRSPARIGRGLRSALALALGLGLFLFGAGSKLAQAQDAGTSASVSFTADDFFFSFYRQDANSASLSDLELTQFFNRANCKCKSPIRLVVKFTASGAAKAATLIAGNSAASRSNVTVTLGETCNNRASDLGYTACIPHQRVIDLGTFRQSGLAINDWTADTFSQHYPASAAAEPVDGGTTDGSACSLPYFTQLLWVLMNTDNAGDFDPPVTRKIPIDLEPPPAPVLPDLATGNPIPGNEAITLQWTTLDSTTQQDILGYQVLCSRDDHDQVFPTGTFRTAYTSTTGLLRAGNTNCPAANDLPLVNADPLFICSDLLPAATDSHRIQILQNAIPYGTTVVAIDKSYNSSVVTADNIRYGTPVPSNDFFHYYTGKGEGGPEGQARGGFCSVVPVSGHAAAWGTGILALGSLVVIRRRRRRR